MTKFKRFGAMFFAVCALAVSSRRQHSRTPEVGRVVTTVALDTSHRLRRITTAVTTVSKSGGSPVAREFLFYSVVGG